MINIKTFNELFNNKIKNKLFHKNNYLCDSVEINFVLYQAEETNAKQKRQL